MALPRARAEAYENGWNAAKATGDNLSPTEPVAWRTFDGEGGYDYRTYEDNETYAAEWAQRNPRHAGWVEPLYAAPPQRKPLTEEEIAALFPAHLSGDYKDIIPYSFARAVERAHGITS